MIQLSAQVQVLLSNEEQTILDQHEAVITRGIKSFIEVGTALLSIRDKRLYRASFATFEDYCASRWEISKAYSARLISSAEIVGEIAKGSLKVVHHEQVDKMSPMGDKHNPSCQEVIPSSHFTPKTGENPKKPLPDSERVARPLASIPKGKRAEVWDAAIEASPTGKPTAKIVQAEVDKALGKSIVNGVLSDDPPEIAAKRASGRMAKGIVPIVTLPDADQEQEPEDAEDPQYYDGVDRGDAWEEPSDDEFVSALPLSKVLSGMSLKIFQADALIWNKLQAGRRKLKLEVTPVFKEAGSSGSKGAYHRRVVQFLKVDHPKHWVKCTTKINGGCDGEGYFSGIGECPKCFGRGYWIQ
jgi:hypothetical protein